MADKSTFIKLDRNIINWRWFTDGKTLRVWIWLLASANIKDHDFLGDTIHRGQVATSRKTIASATGLTEDEVRTALKHLKCTGEITSRIRPKYQVITILSFDKYQKVPGKIPGTSPADPRQIPGTSPQSKNEKNYYFVVEEGKNVCVHTPPSRDEVAAYAESLGIQTDVDAFIQYNDARGWKIGQTKVEDWRPLLQKWTGHDQEAAAPADEPEERGDY